MTKRTYQLQAIPDGKAGTRATLREMAKIVKVYRKAPAIRELALFLCQGLPPKKWAMEAGRIHAYVRDNVRYIKDIRGCETLQTPIQTLKIGQGDCDDKTMLAASLLEACGHPTRLVAVGFSVDTYAHVYPETKIAGKWVALETTEPWPLGRVAKGIKSRMVEHV